MPRPSNTYKSVHVHVDARHFIVDFDEAGEVLRIKERKKYGAGTLLSGLYNACYWNASSHVLGSRNTMPKRIIAAAKAKNAAP